MNVESLTKRMEVGPTSQMLILREQLSNLSTNSAMEFLSGIQKISNNLQGKSSTLTEELALIEENLSEQLNCLKGFKLDLLLMREQIIRLKDDYCHYATLVIETVKKHAPSILVQLQSLSSKQSLLRKLKCEERGDVLLSSCGLMLVENELYGVDALSRKLKELFDHQSIMQECGPIACEYSSKLSILASSIQNFANKKISDTLATIQYPFEDTIDMRSLKKEVSYLAENLSLIYQISEYSSQGSGLETISFTLFEPISKRFLFHFYGDRRTNDICKPQWYLTQTLNWTQANLVFFDDVLTATGNKLNINISATAFFLRSISRLALEKTQLILRDDKIQSDVFLFSHLVDECIAYEEQRFDMDLSQCGFSVLTAFCESGVLSKWIEIETESCIALMDDMLSSADRWQNRFRNMEEADLYMVCECADSFVSLLHSLQMRSKLLPDEIAQRRFVDLQLILADDFRKRLTQIARQAESPWSEPFPHVMNAVWYLGHVVEEWSDACLLSGVQGSGGRAVFDESAAMYRHVWSQLADDVVASMRVLTTDFAREYQQNRWCTMTSRLGTLDRELSILFCPLLMSIRSTFANAGKMISQASLPALFKRMTSALAHIILEDVVTVTSFNAEGATQMLYDMENGLLPVLRNILTRSGIDDFNPLHDNTMATIIGSLTLLSMSWAVATLLREEIEKVPDEVAEEKLLEMGVRGVTREKAEKLFRQRNDLERRNDAICFKRM